MTSNSSAENEVDPLLSEDPFKSEQSQKLFEAIDELRTCGANHEVDLPELVIVGDQSVGKSSLLQSLTDIPFPVSGRLCTRFPTLILSRRTPDKPENTRISIEAVHRSSFGGDQPVDHLVRAQNYASFTRESPHITAEAFMAIVQEATDLMGITTASVSLGEQHKTPSGVEPKHFSDDVLKIEISGPSRSYFSIVDVPGVFQSLTMGLKAEEKLGVKKMVTSYMARPQSIIICVASATNDLATQSVFDMASYHDPKGSRTVGVITKCDIAQDKNQVLELAQNREKHFDHGWFVVRNRTPSEAVEGLKPLERHMRETSFFDTQPWLMLPETRRGTQPLKKYLAALLCNRIEANFPTILSTIKARQTSVQTLLKSMGMPRKTVGQKRTYLANIAYNFHSFADQAVNGRYHAISALALRLRTKIRELNDDFALDMETDGHSTPFVDIPTSKDTPNDLSHVSRWSPFTTSTESRPAQASNDSGILGGFGSLKVGLQNYRFSTPPFIPYSEIEEPPTTIVFQSIPSMEAYRSRSFEEIRLNDYLQAQSTSATPGAANGSASTMLSGGLFGGPSITPKDSAPSAFGNPFSAAVLEGGPGKSAFGTSAAFRSSGSHEDSRPAGGKSDLFGSGTPGAFGSSGSHEDSRPAGEKSNLFGSGTPGGKSNLFGSGTSGAFGSSGSHEDSRPAVGKPSLFGSGLNKPTPNPKTPGRTLIHRADSQIYQWIRDEVKASRGTELQGTLNPDVLPVLFHKQAGRWRAKSEGHFDKVQKMTVSVAEKLVETTCGDKYTSTRIMALIHQANKQATSRRVGQLTERLDEILTKHLQTNNQAFEKKISEARLFRFQEALERYRSSRKSPPAPLFANPTSELIIDMRDTAALFAELHMSNSQNLEDEIHDTLKSYYEIALNDFIEYVTRLIVERYLDDPEGPLLVFSPLYVGGLDDQTVEKLGAEDDSTTRLRAEREETLARLNRAEEIARKYT